MFVIQHGVVTRHFHLKTGKSVAKSLKSNIIAQKGNDKIVKIFPTLNSISVLNSDY